MQVSNLQAFLESVIPFTQAAGASQKVTTDLKRVVDLLHPYAAKSVEELAQFLAMADQFQKTGQIPEIGKSRPKPARAPKSPKTPKLAGAEGIKEATLRVQALYEKAVDPDLSDALIDAELQWLDKALGATELKQVAREVGILKTMKTKKDALNAIRLKIVGRKENAGLIDFGTVAPSNANQDKTQN